MKAIFLLTCILAASSMEWIKFTDEAGVAYESTAPVVPTTQDEATQMGAEDALSFGAHAGGNGGGLRVLSCERRGGIKAICVRTGRYYIGQVRLYCNDNSAGQICGAALGHGSGGSYSCYYPRENFIYAVDVKVLNGYVRAIILRGGAGVLRHWAGSRSGKTIRAGTVKNVLLGFRLRCGWWIDAVSGGFGNQIERSNHRCIRANGIHNQCNGWRCCSRWNWCGGSRDGRFDWWCWHSLFQNFNHIAGLAPVSEDISYGLTTAFAAIIILPIVGAIKLFNKRKENAHEYEQLLTEV